MKNELNDLINKEFDKPLFEKEKKEDDKKANSAAYDRRDYETEGGDGWIADPRMVFYDEPKDKGLWETIREVSMEAFGSLNKKFQIWLYLKRGGQFD